MLDCIDDAMFNVILQDNFSCIVNGRLHGRQLDQNLSAVPPSSTIRLIDSMCPIARESSLRLLLYLYDGARGRDRGMLSITVPSSSTCTCVCFFTHRFFSAFLVFFCAIQISVNVNRWRMPEVSQMSKTRDPSASTVFSLF